MDTRTKVVSPAKARTLLAEGDWLVIAGYFDPLTSSVAQRFQELAGGGRGEKVLAIVLDASEMILTAEARSYLIAALRTVDTVVVISEEALSNFLPPSSRIRLVFDKEAELSNTVEFEALVSRKELCRQT